MSKFAICIEEILSKTVIVNADDLGEAVRKAHDAVKNSEVILTADDFSGRTFKPSKEFGEVTGKVPEDAMISFYQELKE